MNDYLIKPVSDSVLKECLLSIQMQLDMEKNNVHSKVKLEPLANFSLSYIRKLFKREMKYSLGQYQSSLRINEAKTLLLSNPDLAVSSVGKLVGYEDQYYFSRIFHKHTGCYPSNYRSP